jgi:hypothetical protein
MMSRASFRMRGICREIWDRRHFEIANLFDRFYSDHLLDCKVSFEPHFSNGASSDIFGSSFRLL